jgi:hypothetical protein
MSRHTNSKYKLYELKSLQLPSNAALFLIPTGSDKLYLHLLDTYRYFFLIISPVVLGVAHNCVIAHFRVAFESKFVNHLFNEINMKHSEIVADYVFSPD